ncbi:hypothetical protein LG943_16350 [Streptomonospora sp. S1-112]|uniref:Oxalate:formate antiporter n=1 Tax=Streptomonospora mangrovi TaxID=2883123 RepID=A0A9X3SPG6_9ACTN|nr:hypothetical protein [Streptomonospora mangrovi]MDA0565871.1 hypothetical protein [Streptomonospora mangrovi]
MDLPREHAATLARIEARVRADPRFTGLGAGGSLLSGAVDAYSDLDLVVVVADEHHEAVMAARREIAASWGRLLAAFTGEHVGEPRVLICLYADPLLHVDLKFLRADELADRIEDPRVVWERDGALSRALAAAPAAPPEVDPQWIEDRFWIWVHYAATKLGRGELFEVVEFLAFLRARVLVPLAGAARGLEPRGVRKAELALPGLVPALVETAPGYDPALLGRAVLRCVELYAALRDALPDPPAHQEDAARAAVAYLEEVVGR